MKYIMVSIDNWDKTLVQEVLHDTGESVEQGVIYGSNVFSWLLDSICFKCWY